MNDNATTDLREYPLTDLIDELRARQTKEKGTPDVAEITPIVALAGIDSDKIIAEVKNRQKVIYGTDDREDLFSVTDQAVLDDADTVVALFRAGDVVDNGDGTSTLQTQNFGTAQNLCGGEAFRNQPIGAFCSGFLVRPDIVATAGHCVDATNVTNRRFVFGFRMTNATTAQLTINNTEIYSGQRIIGRVENSTGADWALVELDRRVQGHRCAVIRRSSAIPDDDAVHVIGHPSGLPIKHADGANVRDNSPDTHFVANLDTYGGNSGSPVFNSRTHIVEGILVRGETDFVSSGTCNVSLVCPTTGCRGEDCTRTTEFARLLARMFLIRGNDLIVMNPDTLSSSGSDTGWANARLMTSLPDRVFIVRGDDLISMDAQTLRPIATDSGWTNARLIAALGDRIYLVRGDELVAMDAIRLRPVASDAGWRNARLMVASAGRVFLVRDDELIAMDADRLRPLGSDAGWTNARLMTTHGRTVFIVRSDELIAMDGDRLSAIASDTGWTNARLISSSGEYVFVVRNDQLVAMNARRLQSARSDTGWTNARHMVALGDRVYLVRDDNLIAMDADRLRSVRTDSGWANARLFVGEP